MCGGTVGHGVFNSGDWKGEIRPQNREGRGWIDSQALKSNMFFPTSGLSLETCSMGLINLFKTVWRWWRNLEDRKTIWWAEFSSICSKFSLDVAAGGAMVTSELWLIWLEAQQARDHTRRFSKFSLFTFHFHFSLFTFRFRVSGIFTALDNSSQSQMSFPAGIFNSQRSHHAKPRAAPS